MDAFFVRFLPGIERTLAPRDYALLLQLAAGGGRLGAYERLAASGRVDGFLLTDIEREDPRIAVLEARRAARGRGRTPGRRLPVPVDRDRARTGHGGGRRAPRRARARADRLPRRRGPARLRGRAQGALARGARRRRPRARPGRLRGAGRAPAAPQRRSRRRHGRGRTSDVLARLAGLRRRAAGLRVPEDLAVTGFDDSPLAAHGVAAAHLRAGRLRRVRRRRRGRAAARLDGGKPVPGPLSPPELVVRASS